MIWDTAYESSHNHFKEKLVHGDVVVLTWKREWLQAKFWFWPALLWRSTQDQLEIFSSFNTLWFLVFWENQKCPVLFWKVTVMAICYTLLSLSLCSPQTPTFPTAGFVVWEVWAGHTGLRVHHLSQLRCWHWELCAPARAGAQTFLQRGSWTRQPGIISHFILTIYFLVHLHHKLSCFLSVYYGFVTAPAPPAGRGNQGSDRILSILIQYSFKALILILFPSPPPLSPAWQLAVIRN